MRGHRITAQNLDTWLYDDPLIVAHNAPFDRRFFDKNFPTLRWALRWACSMGDVDWRALGYESRGLQHLCWANGFFFGGHRASEDCLALVSIFVRHPEAFAELLATATEQHCRILAWGAPFEVKDRLKARGYSWCGNARVWSRELPQSHVDEERLELSRIYCGGGDAPIHVLDPYRRFAKDKGAA